MLFLKHTKAHNRWSFTSNRKYLNSCGRSPKWRTCSSRRMEPLIMDSQNYTLENQRGTQSWRFGIWFSFSKGWLLGEPCSFSGVSYFFRYRIWRSPVTFIPYHLIKKRYTDIIWYVYIYIFIYIPASCHWDPNFSLAEKMPLEKNILEMFLLVAFTSHLPIPLHTRPAVWDANLGTRADPWIIWEWGGKGVWWNERKKKHLGCNLPGRYISKYHTVEQIKPEIVSSYQAQGNLS